VGRSTTASLLEAVIFSGSTGKTVFHGLGAEFARERKSGFAGKPPISKLWPRSPGGGIRPMISS
jgi:hypothetical protein